MSTPLRLGAIAVVLASTTLMSAQGADAAENDAPTPAPVHLTEEQTAALGQDSLVESTSSREKAASAVSGVSTTRVTKESYLKSLVGLKVVQLTSYTTFSYTGSRLTTPKSVSHSTWSLPPNWTQSSSSGWDWYGTSNGQANHFARFVFGVPTPWGPVGSTADIRHFVNVYSNGTFR